MNKNFIILLLLLCVSFLCSCSGGGLLGYRLRQLNASNEEELADTRLEQVIDTINNRDKDALKILFSEQALGEAKNIDEQIACLFDFIQDNIISWERRSGQVNGLDDDGNILLASGFEYNITTDDNRYIIFLYEITKNTNFPEDIGLYMIQVYTSAYRNDVMDWGHKKKSAGIYCGNQQPSLQ